MATMLLALTTNNMGLLWVAMEAATLSTVLLVTLYRTAGEPRGGLEVLHPVRRRHRPGAVRHDPAVLRGREGPGRAGRERAAVDPPERRQGTARADRARPRLRLPAGRLRHQGRARAAAQLAARRPRRRPDADLGGALRAAAERRDLRGRALQGAGRGLAALAAALADAHGLRPAVGGARGVLPLAPARHQAAVRLLLDRAHGDHHLRLRHGRPGGQLRRAAAHDGALADQVGDLLRRRPRRAEGRLAADGQHPRAHHAQPRPSAGA